MASNYLFDGILGGRETSAHCLLEQVQAQNKEMAAQLASGGGGGGKAAPVALTEADIPADAIASGAERFVAKSQLAPEVLMALTATPPGGGCQDPHQDAT